MCIRGLDEAEGQATKPKKKRATEGTDGKPKPPKTKKAKLSSSGDAQQQYPDHASRKGSGTAPLA